jgi:murein hydrolase activator
VRPFAAATIVLCVITRIAVAGKSEQRLKDVEQRIRRTQDEAKALESKAEGLLDETEALDRSIAGREQALRELQADMRAARTRQETAERVVTRLDEELPRLRSRFAERAGGLYRITRRGLAPLMLQAPREWGDTLRFRRGLEAVVANDRALVEALAQNRAQADAAREEARAQAAALTDQRKRSEHELAALRQARADKKQLLASIRGESDKRAALLDELKSSAERLRQLIEKEEAAKAAPFRPPPGAAASMLAPLRLPAAAVVSARNGVEIRAPAGTPVQAVKAGRVAYAGWFTGYGQMIILDHGDRLYSVYGYVENLAVENGRTVGAGEAIAVVGMTGPVASPTLYFEIRDRGAARDPAAYIKSLAHK